MMARWYEWVKPTGSDAEGYSCQCHLTFRDLFFVRYSAAVGDQRKLDIHQDGSVMSFNIILNSPDEFEGGGTFIEADNQNYEISQGDCFVHASKLRHGGTAITRGERYLLVGFIDVLDKDDPGTMGDNSSDMADAASLSLHD